MLGLTMDQLSVGQSSSFGKTITEADVLLFGAVSGDMNPVHFNETYAAGTMFKKRIAHGVLGTSLISTVLGMQMPGPGTIFLKLDVKFVAPIYLGDTVTATCTVKEKIEDKGRVVFDCVVVNQDGKSVIVGEAVGMPPKKAD
ncbi:MAG: MaoC family dehydratase [Oscillospiraceae bacterium]|nr:MaoC family dehydratase [Oscillospiraceae bacterium]